MFNQAQWASQLLAVLKAHDGTLRTRADAYKALTELVGSLGDKYSAFLDPSVGVTPAHTQQPVPALLRTHVYTKPGERARHPLS